MTEIFDKVATEYLETQRRNNSIVPIGHIICPSTVTFREVGAHNLTEAHDVLRAAANTARREFMGFVEKWDPSTFQQAEEIKAGNHPHLSVLTVKPLPAVVLPHPDTRGRTSIEARPRFNPTHNFCAVGFTAVEGVKPRRICQEMGSRLPLGPLVPRTAAMEHSIWELAQDHFDDLQRFRKVINELILTADEQVD